MPWKYRSCPVGNCEADDLFIPLPQAVAEAWIAATELRAREDRNHQENFEKQFTDAAAREPTLHGAVKRKKSNKNHLRLVASEFLRKACDLLNAYQKATLLQDFAGESSSQQLIGDKDAYNLNRKTKPSAIQVYDDKRANAVVIEL